jgi:hypothetical protein
VSASLSETSADAVYDILGAEQQELAREVLLTMTVASRNGRFTRRPVNRADLYAGHADALLVGQGRCGSVQLLHFAAAQTEPGLSGILPRPH